MTIPYRLAKTSAIGRDLRHSPARVRVDKGPAEQPVYWGAIFTVTMDGCRNVRLTGQASAT